MLIRKGVKEPSGCRLNLGGITVLHTLPVANLVPLFIVYDPSLKVSLALLVLLKSKVSLLYLLLTDGQVP